MDVFIHAVIDSRGSTKANELSHVQLLGMVRRESLYDDGEGVRQREGKTRSVTAYDVHVRSLVGRGSFVSYLTSMIKCG